MPVILLTDAIDPDQSARLAAHAEIRCLGDTGIGTLSEEMTEANIVIVRRNIPAGDIQAARRLRALVRHGAGLDFIPVDTASACGIAVTNTPGCNDRSVAEHVFGMVLALRRDIARNDCGIRAGSWNELRAIAPGTRELQGATLGIVGFGKIGMAVAGIGRFGFGMTVMATHRSSSPALDWVHFCPLDAVLRSADIIVLACPLTPETKSMISRQALDRMRPDALLVNVARGAVVDEEALADALHSGVIGGACLDVFGSQPLPAVSPLRSAPNLLLTPHVAGVTRDSMARMSQAAADDSLLILAGQQPRHLCNAAAWPAIAERWSALPH